MTSRARPPRFRGLDFLMRFQQGKWSEDRIIGGINSTANYHAVPYGLSRVYVDTDRESMEEYWTKYSGIEEHGKRPDIIVFRKMVYNTIKDRLSEDPTLMGENEWAPLIKKCICGIEAENSLWRASKMPDTDLALPLPRKTNIIAPNVWVKEEDIWRLLDWQKVYKKPIYVVQVFYDLAFAARFVSMVKKVQRIERYKDTGYRNVEMKRLGLIIATQKYTDSRTGVSQEKKVYRVHPAAAIHFGHVVEEPTLEVKVLESEKGKIMPYVHFSGGALNLDKEILQEWESL